LGAAAGAVLAVSAAVPAVAQPRDKVTLLTNWVAQAEHGGYYQALATGIYEKAGLDVTIRMGGPQVNSSILLASGNVDFAIGSNGLTAFNYVASAVPMVAVAASFQRDPQCFMAHAGRFKSIADMKNGGIIEISGESRATYWPFFKAKFGLVDEQMRPFTFNLAPLVQDRNVVQQCYVTVSPFQARTAGMEPQVFMFSDHGWATYSAILMTSQKMVAEKPDLVKRMAEAHARGWYSYLYGDPAPANALIRRDNPDYPEALLSQSRDALKAEGIIDSGDALTMGIGAMTDARWKEFFDAVTQAGLHPPTLDYRKAYTLAFVGSKAGMELKK